MKTKESLDQNDRLKALEFDLQKTLIRIAETEKVVEARNYDIRNKSAQLSDTEKECARVKDLNNQSNVEIVALRKDVDRVSADCYDLRKNIESTEGRNVELGAQVRSQDINIKEKEDNIYGVKKDIEHQ
jgi:septal ring factor EnvC (AmiA/AmiB activator)